MRPILDCARILVHPLAALALQILGDVVREFPAQVLAREAPGLCSTLWEKLTPHWLSYQEP